MKRRRITVLVLLSVVLAALLVRVLRPREPMCEGVSVNAWLNEYSLWPGNVRSARNLTGDELFAKREQAIKALRSIGTNAIPFIFRRVTLGDSYWHKKYTAVVDWMPESAHRFLPEPMRALTADEASMLFQAIGPSSLPQLADALGNSNKELRLAIIRSIPWLTLADKTQQRDILVQRLVPLLKEADRDLRRASAEVLADRGWGSPSLNLNGYTFWNSQEETISGLTTVLNDPSAKSDLLMRGAYILGNLGPCAADAVPGLKQLLPNTNYLVRREAALAISQIDPRVDAIQPVLIDLLSNDSVMFNVRVIQALGERGPRASNAIPALVTELKKVNEDMSNTDQSNESWRQYSREKITNALFKINPEAAAKLLR